MKGKHLTQNERFYIEKRRSEGANQASIARELQRPRSAISRELRRNTDSTFNGIYSCRRAETLARSRRQKAVSRNAFHQLTPEAQHLVRQELSAHTSPEVISGRLKLKLGIAISKNTLYRYIQQERQAGGSLYQQLPHRGKRYNYNSGQPKRGPIPNRTGIELRPQKLTLNSSPGILKLIPSSAKTRNHSC